MNMKMQYFTRILKLGVMFITVCSLMNMSYGMVQDDRRSDQQEDRVRTELFGELDKLFEKARAEKVLLLSPENFQRAQEIFEKAVQDYEKGEKLKKIRDRLAEAQQILEGCFEAARLSRIALEGLIKIRQDAIDVGTDILALEKFAEAEQKFRQAAEQVEYGDVKKAKSIAQKAEKEYRDAVIQAFRVGPLANARNQFKENKKYIPKEDYKEGEQLLDQVEESVESASDTEFEVRNWWEIGTLRINDALRVQLEGLKLILPDVLLMGGFRLEVIEYTKVSDGKLSGKAYGYFLTSPCSGEETILFEDNPFEPSISIITPIFSQQNFTVEFKDIEIQNWPSKKIEKIVKGKIEQAYDPAIELIVSDFDVFIQKITIEPDSAEAEVIVKLPTAAINKPVGCEKAGIGPVTVDIDTSCSIYKDLPSYKADSLLIGNTGILISINGVKIDFKSSTKKVVFKSGKTITQKPFQSNSGYLLGKYTFSNGEVIECEGFKASMILQKPWTFHSLVPLDFRVDLNTGKLEIEKSWIKKGGFTGNVRLPQAVNNSNGDKIIVNLVSAEVDSQLNFSAKVIFDRDQDICWGGFNLQTDDGTLLLPSTFSEYTLSPMDTTSLDKYKLLDDKKINPKLKTLPGLTIDLLHPVSNDRFTVNTQDCKNPLSFPLQATQLCGWLNIETKGITGELQSKEEMKLMDAYLGIPGEKDYVSNTPFTASVWHQDDSLLWVDFKFVRNAAFDSYIGGYLDIPYPCGITPKYKDMEVTSTAELVGGDVFFKRRPLQYWGVVMTAEKTGNILSVDLGKIIYMNSQIEEKVHFTKPFRIIWGEMLADGGLGKFLFDYNCAGQKFDGFPFTLHTAGLSKYDSTKSKSADKLGYLRAYGDLHFDFFGAKRMDINDYKYQGNDPKKIYRKRIVFLDKSNCDLKFNKNWANKTARMVFDVGYDQDDQNGFKGLTNKMKVDFDLKLSSIANVQTLIPIKIDLNSGTSFIHFCEGGDLKLLSGGNDVKTIGGIIQIKGDAIKRIYLEGHASLKEWDLEANSLTAVEITPSNTTLFYRGQLTFDTYGFGILGMVSARFVLDKKEPSLDGDISGVFRVYSGGVNIAEIYQSADYFNMEARGRLNFHVGTKSNYVQGYAKIKITWGVEVNCQGAFFIGYNAPTEKIWALDKITRGPSIRGIIKDGMETDTLTGFYFAGLFGYDINFYVISGGIKLWAGVGFFQQGTGSTFIGHGGAELHGKVLGGVLSASVWAELLAGTKVNPTVTAFPNNNFHLCLQGTMGFKVCALVVFCASFEGEIHIDEKTRIGLGGCN